MSAHQEARRAAGPTGRGQEAHEPKGERAALPGRECPDCGGSGQVTVDVVVGRDLVDRRGTWTVVDVTEPGVDACRRCAAAAEAEFQSKLSGGVAA